MLVVPRRMAKKTGCMFLNTILSTVSGAAWWLHINFRTA